MKYTLSLALSILASLAFLSCSDDANFQNHTLELKLPETSFDYISEKRKIENLKLPDFTFLNSIHPSFSNSQVFNGFNSSNNFDVDNNEAATLGRVLFYDGKLSKNNATACASCHHQEKAFADASDLSPGFGGKLTTRNSMGFSNLSTNNNFFWDSRQNLMTNLVKEPVTNHIEMGMEDMPSLIEKLKTIDYYPQLFEDAYGSSYIDEHRYANAISQFLASITSTQSSYDRAIEKDFEPFSELQKLGMAIFFSDKAKCSSCHSGVNFAAADGSAGEYAESAGTANIGLDLSYADQGKHDGQFKIPSLRNIALTAPYMHDGRFESLRDVLNHYNQNIQAHENLDEKLKSGGKPIKLGLNSLELDALEAFLETLSDDNLVNNPMFSNPFQF